MVFSKLTIFASQLASTIIPIVVNSYCYFLATKPKIVNSTIIACTSVLDRTVYYCIIHTMYAHIFFIFSKSTVLLLKPINYNQPKISGQGLLMTPAAPQIPMCCWRTLHSTYWSTRISLYIRQAQLNPLRYVSYVIFHFIHFTWYISLDTFHSIYFTRSISLDIFHAIYFIRCISCDIFHTIYFIQYTLYCILRYILYIFAFRTRAPSTMHFIL